MRRRRRRCRNSVTTSSPPPGIPCRGRRGSSPEIVERVNREIVRAADRPQVRRQIEQDAIEAKPMSPAEVRTFMQSEIDRWTPMIAGLAGARQRAGRETRMMLEVAGDMAQFRQGPRALASLCILACAALLAGAFMSAAPGQGVPDYAAIVAAPDRSDADREIDKRRDPVKLLAFTGVRPGMKVLDMGAGGGYSTELMARAADP